MPQPPRYIVQQAAAACSRSTLDLLALPLPFTQTPLLDPGEFAAEATKRSVRVETAQLEVLHRVRLLVPFFEVSLGTDDPRRAVDYGTSETPRIGTTTLIMELYRAAGAGRAYDARRRRFRPWPTRRNRTLWPQRGRGYLYSWHQLLALDTIETALAKMRHDRSTRTWSLPATVAPTAWDVAAADSWRRLAVTLAAIDARYWPVITHSVHYNAEAWRDFNQSFGAGATLDWTGLDVEEVVRGADQLRNRARHVDPLGAFFDLVRRADPESWQTMRGDALVAMDRRVASEALDSFADDNGRRVPQGEIDATPTPALRLSTRRRTTDAVLTELGISPHPSLVVGAEGATEAEVLPRVFEQLGVPLQPDWIRIAEFGGVDKDLTNLAKFAAAPVIGQDHGGYVELDRPITRFLVLVDAERKYSTVSKRARQRKLLLDAIAEALPKDLCPDLYGKDARIVEIKTWGRYPFEFAHLTDRQLATALAAAAKTAYPAGAAALVADVSAQRGRPSPNIEKLWANNRWPGSLLSKTSLVDAYWPVLHTKIERAIASGAAGPPVMRAVLRAWELASIQHRNRMALKRH